MNENYNGIVEDIRSEEEKVKDFKAKELLVSATNLNFRKVSKLEEVKVGKIRNQNGSGSCFPAGTRVLMEDLTYKEIQKIRLGDKVLTDKGTKHKVTHLFKRKWQGNTYSIKVKGIKQEIEATGEHPFLILDGHGTISSSKKKKANWEEARFINKGDFVALPLNNFSKDLTLRDYEKDPEFLWALGLYLAEGSIDKYCVAFSLHKKETDYYERLKRCFANYGSNVTISLKTGSNGMQVKLQGKEWTDIFKDLGNKLCENKKINERLMLLDPILQKNIVDGFFDGDGHISKKGRNVFVSTSGILLEQIQIILRRNGVHTYIQTRKKGSDRKQVYVLEYSETSKFSFYRDGYIFVRIESIKKNTSYAGGHVYNIEVETENTYQVEGVAVHNCVANSICKALEMAFARLNIEVQFSSLYHYQNRPNRPAGGMHPPTACEWVRKNGILLETTVPSMNMTDEMMDNFVITGKDKEKAFEYFKNKLVEYYVDNTPTFEETAQYVEQNGNAMILVRTTYGAWCKDKPDAVKGDVVNHEVCVVDVVNYENENVLFVDDSWGKWWSSEMGERGQRVLNKNTFETITTQVITWKIKKLEEIKNVELQGCKYGDKNENVKNLQNYLKFTKDFPETQTSTGYYGDTTAKAVLSWQIKNKVDTENNLRNLKGWYFGSKSLLKITTAGYNPPAQTIMKFKINKFLLQAFGVFISAFLIQIGTGITSDFTFSQQAIVSLLTSAGLYGFSVLKTWIKSTINLNGLYK